MEVNIRHWHNAAKKFNDIIHREENIHERMMKPGECVIFDNRRVLHARKAFEVADAGKERWLRGAYLDKDPFMSKLRVLAHRFSTQKDSVMTKGAEEELMLWLREK
jgi:gamma-butyrobetaine dioxygenase